MRAFVRFIRDARGATAIEYGLIVALIVIVITASIGTLGGTNGGIWANFTGKIVNATS